MNKLILIAFTFFLVACQVEKKAGKDEFIADHRSAKNSFTVSTNLSGTFKEGQKLEFTLSFPSNVVVTGFPQLSFEFGSITRYAQFTGGNGTKSLTFEYTVQSGDDDSDGIRFLGINLNDSTLQYYFRGELTDCSTSMDTVHFAQIMVDTTGPIITKITHALAGDFYWKDNLTFSVQFNEPVRIKSGSPALRLRLDDGGWKQAQYVSGAGTTTLVFRYTVENNVVDNNGPTFDNSANLITGAVLEDNLGNVASIAYPASVTPTSAIRINGRVPKLVDVQIPTNKTYRVSEHLDFKLVFDRNVSITGVNPYLDLTVGSDYPRATLYEVLENTLTFRYTILPDQIDLDGIELSNTIANATSIVADEIAMTGLNSNNDLKNPNTSKIIVNAITPKITRITRGTDTTRQVSDETFDNVWIIGQQLFLLVEFTSVIDVNINLGSPVLHFSIGGVNKTASYITGGSDTNIMTFVYTVQEGDESTGDEIGISHIELNNAVVIDQYGTIADFTIPNSKISETTIDGIRPTIKKVNKPADGYYSDEHSVESKRYLELTTEFSEPVHFSDNNINIPLVIGAQTRPANLFSDNNSSTPVFRYSIANGDNDLDGITIQSPLNTGTSYTVRDLAGNEMTDKSFSPPVTTGVIVDTTHPTVTISNQPEARVFLKGETLTLELTFNETVKIQTSDGYPRFPITNLSPKRYFTPNFASGTEGTVFEFKYDVQPDDLSSSFINLETMQHNGTSSIKDRAENTYVVGLLNFTNQIEVDAKDVTIASTSASPSGYYKKDDTLEIDVTFSEAVTVTGNARIIAHANDSDYVFTLVESSNNTSTLKFTHTLTGDDLFLDGLGAVGAITLEAGASIKDNHGIDAETVFEEAVDLSGIKLLPSKFKAWIQNPASTTDVISGSEDLFTGQLNIVNGHSLFTTVSASSIVANINFTTSSGSFLGGVSYSALTEELPPPEPCEEEPCEEVEPVEPAVLGIILDNSEDDIASVYINDEPIPLIDNKFTILKTPGTQFKLEINLNNSISGTLFAAPEFVGQISSILLLDSSLTNEERDKLD